MAKDTEKSRWHQPMYGKMVKDETSREKLVIKNQKRAAEPALLGLISLPAGT